MNKLGILLVKKPVGISSFDIIRKLRRILNIRQLGHTGTLDPFAEGLMQILVGKATKVAQYLTSKDKKYLVTLKFGIKSDSGDITGNIVEESNIGHLDINFDKLKSYVENLKEQIPPNYSAIKVKGQRAYKLARKEVDFILPSRSIKISEFEIIDYTFPYLTYKCRVSKGTYIRSLTEQIAEFYHTIATTVKLVRVNLANVDLNEALDLDELTSDNWENYLLPLEKFLDFPVIQINEHQSQEFWHGRCLQLQDNYGEKDLVIVKEGELTRGLAKISGKTLHPSKVFK